MAFPNTRPSHDSPWDGTLSQNFLEMSKREKRNKKEKKKKKKKKEVEEEESGEESGEESEEFEVAFKDKRWPNPIYAGWMWKYTVVLGRVKWNHRYFILDKSGELWYFKSEKNSKPRKGKPVVVKDLRFWKSNIRRHCIQIEKYPKPFYICANKMNNMLVWVQKLQNAGGIYDTTRMIDHKPPEIASIGVKNWSNDHVIDWLSFMPFSGDETFSIYEVHFKEVDGKKLVVLTEGKLKELGINSFLHRKKMARSIRYLKNKNKFNYPFHVVLKKLVKMLDGKSGRVRVEQQRQVALNLSDSRFMVKTYLSLESLQEFFDEALEKEEEDDINNDGAGIDLTRKGNPGAAAASNSPSPSSSSKKKKKKKDDQVQRQVLDEKNVNFPVKLVVTEVIRNNRYKTARRLLSPIMSNIPRFSQEFGIFHTALIVGPWYLEWNNSSLVVPRTLSSSMALLSADIDDAGLIEKFSLDEIVNKIAQVVTTWNCTKTYDNMNTRNEPHLGNCQQFVEDLMAALGVTMEKKGAFGKYLERMRTRGCCKMELVPSKEFKENYKIKEQVVKFRSHIELDRWMEKMYGIDPISFRMDFLEEFKLLKSFDRAYWLRHLRNPEIEKFKPLPFELSKNQQALEDGNAFPTGCPFKDPRGTKSYMVYSKRDPKK